MPPMHRKGARSAGGEEALGTYITGRVPAAPGFGRVLRVGVGFGCAGTETHAHDDWRIRFCPMCGRELRK